MKIKKLEMVGFKSFVDRTVVHFDDAIIGIVGPNGCGKSNIVDAIRWCMGEQSAKHLRGRSMEDVLFSGSESRAGCDMAEVTITFENDNPGDVPVEMRDYPEIAVSRRLYRNGDSEYLMNKTQVRLKDITDLFLGTGIGTKAYSIVEQGRIGLIVSAKPEDRRLLIEEAAGITKYKSKKRQAERKMELTQQNLLRVGDIVAEIEKNLGSLKRQAQKAERYLTYRQELEDLQLHEASHRWLELDGYSKFYGEQTLALRETHETARGDVLVRDAELEAARALAIGAEETLEKAQNTSFAADNEVRTEESAIERSKDKLESLRTREAHGEVERRALTDAFTRLDTERTTQAAHVTDLQEELGRHESAVAAAEERVAVAAADHSAAEGRAAEERSIAYRAQSDIASAEAKLEGFDQRQAEMRARSDRLAHDRDNLLTTLAEHEGRVNALTTEQDDLRAGKVVTEDERGRQETFLADLRASFNGSERALEDARTTLAQKRSRLLALQEVHSRLDGVGEGTKELLQTRDPVIVGIVADRVEAPAELAAAVAALLGARVHDVVVSDMQRGVELLATLGRDKKGRATIVPHTPPYVAGARPALPASEGIVGLLVDMLRYLPEDEALARWLAGDAVVVRDENVALALRQAGVGAPIVTIDGLVIHADGRISGGTGEDVAKGVLDVVREMHELDVEVAEHTGLAARRLAEHQMLMSSIAETQAALDRARTAAHESELRLVTCDRDLHSAREAAIAVEQRAGAVERERGELDSAIQKSEDERDAAAATLSEAKAAFERASASLATAETESATLRGILDDARQRLVEHKVHLATAGERTETARGALYRVERSLEELAEREARLDKEVAEIAQSFGETAAQLVGHTEARNIALDRAREAAETLSHARAEYDAIRQDLSERESILKDLRAAAEDARSALSDAEMTLQKHALALEHLLESVAEKFRGLRLHRVVGDYHLRPPPTDETRTRISELTGLIDRMGSVNLEATREHAEAEQRYISLSTQKADLEKALADLQRAIQQMNRESRRLFAETFEAVNLKFQEIFPKMFRGGRASLRLTNPEDMLETGVDILAQPPGKKLSSIELMSGGEKALTAVSLIFAIFQHKPSPFCILDEVDAPLDEANVARYNDMVRSMTHQSQFILITHIKRTMQMVDILYGVTMQESGVSRMVSVRMGEGKLASTTPSTETQAQVQVA